MWDRMQGSGMVLIALAMALAAPGAAGAQSDLSDPEVAHVAVTANAIDVEMAELVPSRTDDAAVRAFARTMVRDHTAVNERAAALAGRTTENGELRALLEEVGPVIAGHLEHARRLEEE